ncbi:DNA polymerase alpha subunit B N-terminal-domain-containing protein [Peziza echinospora]|nr:DNA polymerase alpha subunit B N-terminal-domain-containing protein [Peziza echinospora]
MDDDTNSALAKRFGNLTPDVAGELASMLRIFTTDIQELWYKWESYCIKLGLDRDHKMSLENVRDFKKDVQDALEKEVKNRARGAHGAGTSGSKRAVKRESGADGLGLFETPQKNLAMKRKFERVPYESPGSKSAKMEYDMDIASSPMPMRTPLKPGPVQQPQTVTPFNQRPQPGTIRETLNDHIPKPSLPYPDPVPYNTRVNLTVNFDLKKLAYRPMHQKQSEASEMLDDKIEDVIALVSEFHSINPEEFGDPSSPSPSEVVAVGRIVSDSLVDGKLNSKSVLLEGCRRLGAGARVPLKLDNIQGGYSFFPGQIVALRGVSPNGTLFTVKEVLKLPPLPPPASDIDNLIATAEKLSISSPNADSPSLNILIAAGPYTTDDNLDFEPLQELCQRAATTRPDAVILLGPFIDIDHPLVAAGDFDIDPDLVNSEIGGTLEDLFHERIVQKIRQITDSLVLLVPSIRDAVSKHVSFPQDALPRRVLGLPKNVKSLPNPAIFSLNEVLFATTTADVLMDLVKTQIYQPPRSNVPSSIDRHPSSRAIQHILSQRSLYPVFPSNPAQPIDLPYLRLADFVNVAPDVLILPSQLDAFAKIVDSVVAVNPGGASKKMASGTFAEVSIGVRDIKEGDEEEASADGLTHNVWERARVDILRV